MFVLTTASVMALQMPEPPPVQKSTLPLKMSSLNTDVESTAGASTYASTISFVIWVQVLVRGRCYWYVVVEEKTKLL